MKPTGPNPEQHERIHALLHAIQSGVKIEQEYGSEDGSPKHLRVGVNNALLTNAAMAYLLIEKGVFTVEEYWDMYESKLQEEVQAYEDRLTSYFGTKITLG